MFEDNYKATLVILRTNFGKNIAFYIPERYQKETLKFTDKQ